MQAGRKPLSESTRRRGERMAKLIRTKRNRKGLTQEDLAEKSGVSAGTVRKIESAETLDPGFFTVADVARVLGLNLDALAKVPRGTGGRGAAGR